MRHKIDGTRDGHATRFVKGRSGNPGGKPKIEREVVELARGHGPECIQALVRIMRGPKSRPEAVIAAATAILDRAFGRPKQVADLTVRRTLREMSDDELLAIIGGERDAGEAASPAEPERLH